MTKKEKKQIKKLAKKFNKLSNKIAQDENAPNKGHVIETTHTLYMIGSNIEDFVLGGALMNDKRYAKILKEKCEEASKLIYEAYQEINAIKFHKK